MILAILLAISAAVPRMVLKPIPHWSCPSGFEVQFNKKGNVCRPVPPYEQKIEGYNAQSEEQIHWKFSRRVPVQGIINVRFPNGFLHEPGCGVTDKRNSKAPVYFSKQSILGVTVTATPSDTLVFDCRGIVKRNLQTLEFAAPAPKAEEKKK